MRKTLKPATVFGAFNDLRSFFGWLAKDTRTANIMEGMKYKTPSKAAGVLAAMKVVYIPGRYPAVDGRCRSLRISCGSLAFCDSAQAWFVLSAAVAALLLPAEATARAHAMLAG
jgi:hypothetical protein